MHAFDILGDPVRRRILELLADDEQSAGAIGAVVQEEFGISQPAVSQHLRVLRESGFATVRPDGARRLYAEREPIYQHADLTVWSRDVPHERIVDECIDALHAHLCGGSTEQASNSLSATP